MNELRYKTDISYQHLPYHHITNQKTVYLTIDDGPSVHFKDKVNYLTRENIPAIFFVVGRKIVEKNESDILYAIRNGFIVENHSYSHRSFSELSLNEAKDEIKKADNLLNRMYEKAGVKRQVKLFRFPFFDRGRDNGKDIQDYLKLLGYRRPDFGVKHPRFSPVNSDIDVDRTINLAEYKQLN